MTKESILILADDPGFCQAVQERMQSNHTKVVCTSSPVEILGNRIDNQCCLIIIDMSLKGMEMLSLLQMVRSSFCAPILTLEQDNSERKRIALFQAGANACLDKPVDLDVCTAQAWSLIQLYRGNLEHKHLLAFGKELLISLHRRQVLIDGQPVQLTRKEFDLLHCLASSPEQVFSLEQLYQYVWNEVSSIGGDETVRVHLKKLRKKLASFGKDYIQNVRGVGYKFVLVEELAPDKFPQLAILSQRYVKHIYL